uniref:hypothetical protein n=1 Tax=Aquipuribacter hungaricus TaxID=545624 RepID=UPI0030EB14FC
MTTTTTPTPGPSGPSGERAGLTLTRREARALARRARQGSAAGQGERWLPRFWQQAAAGRAAARRRA